MIIKRYARIWFILLITAVSANKAADFSFDLSSLPIDDDAWLYNTCILPDVPAPITPQEIEPSKPIPREPKKAIAMSAKQFLDKVPLQLACPECPLKLKKHNSFCNLCSHYTRAHREISFRCEKIPCNCPFCPDVQVVGKSNLYDHFLKAHDKETLIKVSATKKPLLKNFIETYLKEQGFGFNCTFCPDTFPLFDSLQEHYTQQHSSENLAAQNGRYTCCNQTFLSYGPSSRKLADHIETHQKECTLANITTHFDLVVAAAILEKHTTERDLSAVIKTDHKFFPMNKKRKPEAQNPDKE